MNPVLRRRAHELLDEFLDLLAEDERLAPKRRKRADKPLPDLAKIDPFTQRKAEMALKKAGLL